MRSPKLVILLLCFLISLLSKAQQDQNDTIESLPNPSDQFADKKEIQEVAPVLFEGDTLFLIKYAPREFSVSFRADQISQQLELISKVYNPVIDSIYAKKEEGFISVMYNDKVAFVVTENDAKAHNLSLSALAETELNSFKKAMEVHIGYNLSITDWFIRIGYFLISLVVLLGLLWLVRWSFRKLNQYLSKFEKRFLKNTKNIFKVLFPEGRKIRELLIG